MFVNSFHGYGQSCPHSTSVHDMETSISMEENLRKGKATKQVSAFVTLLWVGVCVCSVTHKSTCFRLISNL